MDIKQQFREEKNIDVYATNVNDGDFSNVYVKWLEAKLTLTDVVSTFFCEDEDLEYSSEKCKEQCSGCKWIENL